jgi:transposase/type II secretory pathway pseudopilin PulG
LTIVAGRRLPNSARPRFRSLPWHDTHPAKLDIERRLDPGHLARTFECALDRLDCGALYAAYGNTGSAAHSPARLLAVVLYEIRRGRHSPAQWHRDARECEPVRWLLRGSVVARSCWYAFRDRVAPLLPDFHRQVLALALDAGLTPATRAADDGTLVAANASRHKVVNLATLEKRALPLAAALAEDQRQAAAPAAPAAATTLAPAVPATAVPAAAAVAQPAWLAASVAGRQQQQQRLEQARQRLQELHGNNQHKWPSKQKQADAIVVSLSDPQAVVGRDKEKVFRPLYNVQVLADLDSPLILGYAVFAQQNDAGVLGTMLVQARQQLGHGLDVVLVDGAYASGADLAAAQREGVTVYAPVPGDGVAQPKQIPKREFTWLAAEQTYVCPQGHRLVFEESWQEKRAGGSVKVWRYRCPPEHCQGCPLQSRCTATPASGRAVTRQEHEELIEALRARMATGEAKALYRLRGQNVELVNADWKEHRKLRRFSGRGLLRVGCEVGLTVLAHNLLTVLTEKKPQNKQTKEAAANPRSQRT